MWNFWHKLEKKLHMLKKAPEDDQQLSLQHVRVLINK